MIRPSVRLVRRAAPLLLAALAIPSTAALAADPPGDPQVTVKDTRQAVPRSTPRRASAPAATRARADFLRRLGARGVLDIDPVTGTVRSVLKAGGTLTGPSSGSRGAVVRGWLRRNAPALGLDAGDVDALGTPEVTEAPGGLSVLRFRQRIGGIPAFAGGVRAGLDRGNRLLGVSGSPIHDLQASSTTPRLSASEALRALADETGGGPVPAVSGAATGPRRTTRFETGDVARLTLFGAGSKQRLAWHATYLSPSGAWWDGVVDAATGAVLYRQDLVRHAASAEIFENYPGAPGDTTATTVDLETLGFLPAGAANLTGPYARAYSDVNGDNVAQAGEEVGRTNGGFSYPFQRFFLGTPRCEDFARCSWNSSLRSTYAANRENTTVQAFWFSSNFHDHLEQQPIGFDAASGAFEGSDPVLTETDDSIAPPSGDPQLNNANIATPPDGQSPRMQMYLGAYDVNGAALGLGDGGGLFRDYNNSDDAATVYHEYTHGLSNRLVTNADGSGALSSAQSGAMGEAWSDWYAFDYLVGAGLVDDTSAPDEIDIGNYSDAVDHATRFQAVDCAVGDPAADCPGGAGTAGGGFTYADFGKVCCSPSDLRPEVHSDGEIWAETLWDLRRTINDPVVTRALVTTGMRLSPPEPSFLDMRNSILQADAALYSSSHTTTIWSVFANRGMGYFAAATDGNDTSPVADATTPAQVATLPTGALRGRITDQDTGKPVAGATVGVGGLSTAGFSGALAATTAADGTYEIPALPQHTYPRISVQAGRGYFTGSLSNVAISGGATTTADLSLRRSLAVGAALTTDDETGGAYACGSGGLTDGNLGTVWELDLVDAGRTVGYQAHATVDLGRAADVYAYGIDPSSGCGSGAAAAARAYRLEASADGQSWTTVADGTLDDGAGLDEIRPSGAGATGVRYVRLTVTADADHVDYGFLDVAELAVFGHFTPAGGLSAAPSGAAAGTSVTLDASSFTTDERAAITAYEWDFDGDGTVDGRTSTPTTTKAFGATGLYSPLVTVRDDLGGAGSARGSVAVTAATSTPAPTRPARPSVRFLKGRRGTVRLRVTCARRCTTKLTAVLSRRAARELQRKRRTIARRSVRLTGTRTVTLTVSKKTRRALRRQGARSVRASVRVAVTMGATTRKVARTVRIRL